MAKLNPDWLRGEPVRTWLAERAGVPLVGPFFASETGVFFFAYGGLAFDLLIGFLLLGRKTRAWALIPLLFFHVMNDWLFTLGVFPFLMIAATVLFFDFGDAYEGGERAARPWVVAFIAAYFAVQVAVPFRHLIYPGNVLWTDEGERFAWRMKLRGKKARFRMTLADPETGVVESVDPPRDLDGLQIFRMEIRPDMILQYAHHLRDRRVREGRPRPIIRAEVTAKLNDREPQPLIDPDVNLSEVEDKIFSPSPWIVPLRPFLW